MFILLVLMNSMNCDELIMHHFSLRCQLRNHRLIGTASGHQAGPFFQFSSLPLSSVSILPHKMSSLPASSHIHQRCSAGAAVVKSAAADNNRDMDNNGVLDSNDTFQHATKSVLLKRTVVRPSMSYRPRGALARAVFEKVHNDQYLDSYDMQLVSATRRV